MVLRQSFGAATSGGPFSVNDIFLPVTAKPHPHTAANQLRGEGGKYSRIDHPKVAHYHNIPGNI